MKAELFGPPPSVCSALVAVWSPAVAKHVLSWFSFKEGHLAPWHRVQPSNWKGRWTASGTSIHVDLQNFELPAEWVSVYIQQFICIWVIVHVQEYRRQHWLCCFPRAWGPGTRGLAEAARGWIRWISQGRAGGVGWQPWGEYSQARLCPWLPWYLLILPTWSK